MAIKNYTTKIDVYKTLGEIQGILVKHKAKKILQDYDDDGRITSLSFMVDTPTGPRGIRLPADVLSVQKVLRRQKVNCEYEQAERVAWRNVKDWIDAQMAMLEAEQVSIDEIFFPYVIDKSGKTLYQRYADGQLLLTE